MVEHNCNINKIDQNKHTAFFFAKQNNHQDLINFLLSKNAIATKDGIVTKNDLQKLKKGKKLTSEHSVLTNTKKKKSLKAKDSQKFAYHLVFHDEDNQQHILSPQDFEEFKGKFPTIGSCILNPELILENDVVLTRLKHDNWRSNARKILDLLWKCKDAKLFHHPVDPVALKIPDYLQVIKRPMDFSTIRRKLNQN